MVKSSSRRVERITSKSKTFLVAIFLFSLLLLTSVSAVGLTNYYRSDLSDLFNDASINTTKWAKGTDKFVGCGATATQTETTYYAQGVNIADCGSNSDYAYAWTYSNASYKTSVFDTYDIYLNFTTTAYAFAGAEVDEAGIGFINESGGSQTTPNNWLLNWYKVASPNSVWHIQIDVINNNITSFNQDESVNTSIIAKGNSWRLGWYSRYSETMGTNTGLLGELVFSMYNYSVFQTEVPFIESSQTYNSTVWETSSQTFINNVAIDNASYNTVSATFNYNGVNYLTTVDSPNSSSRTLTSTIDIPAVTVNTAVTFNWTVTLTGPGGTTTVSTANYNQTINNTVFTECNATNNVAFVNFTTFEEGTWLELNSSVEFSLTYWLGSGNSYEVLSYNNLNNNQSKFNFCFKPSTSTIHGTGVIDYYYIQPTTNLTYSRRSHYFDNASFSSISPVIPLYLLTENSSTLFTFTVVDENNNPVQNAFINVLRWDIGTGNFYTVDGVKTDYLGQGTAQIRLNDAWYVYEVIVNGRLYLTTDPVIETTNSRTLVISLTATSIYLEFGDLSYAFTYNNNTQTFKFIFADTTGKVTTGCLRVININADNETYNSCVYSTSGTLTYTLTENATYIGQAIFRINVNNQTGEQIVKTLMVTLGMPERFAVIGTYGRVAAILLIGTLSMIGVASGSIILACFLLVAGVIVSYLLGLVYFSSLVMYSIVAVVIVLALLARRRMG